MITHSSDKTSKVCIDNRCFLTKMDKLLYMARLKWIYLTQVKQQCEGVQSQYHQTKQAIVCRSLSNANSSELKVHVRSAFSPKRENNQRLWNLIKDADHVIVAEDCIEAIQTIMQRAEKLAINIKFVQEELDRMFDLYDKGEYELFYNAKYESSYPPIIKWCDMQRLTLVTAFVDAWMEVQSDFNTLQNKEQCLKDCAKLLVDKNLNRANESQTDNDESQTDKDDNKKIIELSDEALFNKLTAMGNYLNVNFTEGIKQICTPKLLSELSNEPVKEENTVNEIGKGVEYKQMNKLYCAICKAQHPPVFNAILNPLGYALLTHAMCEPNENRFRVLLYEYDWHIVGTPKVAHPSAYEEWEIEWDDEEEWED